MAETPKDFARHLLLRSHPALCTPSGFYSPGRSSYPSRPYFCVSLEEFFFTTKIHPRSWKKKRLAIGVPLHDPENEETQIWPFPFRSRLQMRPKNEGKETEEESQRLHEMLRWPENTNKEGKNITIWSAARKRVTARRRKRSKPWHAAQTCKHGARRGRGRRCSWMKKLDEKHEQYRDRMYTFIKYGILWDENLGRKTGMRKRTVWSVSANSAFYWMRKLDERTNDTRTIRVFS